MQTSMRRHFLSRPTWRPFVVERNGFVSFAMLPSALFVSLLFGDSVHCEIHLFGLIEGAAIFGAVSLPQRGWTKFALRSRLMLDPKRSDTQKKPYVSL
jgi:hypothetical protein